MKIEVTKDTDNRPNGFKLIPDREDKNEVNNINIIRDMIYFSIDSRLAYDGREGGDEKCAGTLNFKMNSGTLNFKMKNVDRE